MPDTVLTQTMCLVLILQPNTVGTVKPAFSEETEAWGYCLVGGGGGKVPKRWAETYTLVFLALFHCFKIRDPSTRRSEISCHPSIHSSDQ